MILTIDHKEACCYGEALSERDLESNHELHNGTNLASLQQLTTGGQIWRPSARTGFKRHSGLTPYQALDCSRLFAKLNSCMLDLIRHNNFVVLILVATCTVDHQGAARQCLDWLDLLLKIEIRMSIRVCCQPYLLLDAVRFQSCSTNCPKTYSVLF